MKTITLLLAFIFITHSTYSSSDIEKRIYQTQTEKGVILEWQDVNASAYDIYFGETSASSRIVLNTTERRYVFTDLEINKRYYYKIVPKGSTATFDQYSFRYKEEGVKIFDGNVALTYQEEITDFAKKNYTEITGFLDIQQNSRRDIRELGWFQNLTKVGGLYLSYIEGLTSLYGFHNLSYVTGNVSITNVPNIKEINFDKLVFISGSLTISGNRELEKISMKRLYRISFDLNMGGNVSYILDNEGHGYTAFTSDTSYGNPLVSEIFFDDLQYVRGNINFYKNESLATLNCLSAIKEGAYKDLIIWNNDELTDISALENMTVVAESLAIVGNDRLENLNGLENITIIAFDMLISNNGKLTALNFNEIDKVGQILIEDNNSLDNVTGLKSLNEVGKVISIRNNQVLDNYCGITNLIRSGGIGDYLRVYGNAWNPTSYSSILNVDCSSTLSTQTPFYAPAKIFPNPTQNYITIESHNEISKVILYNSLGKKVTTHTNSKKINIEHLTQGIYFAHIISSNSKKEIVKIIKE